MTFRVFVDGSANLPHDMLDGIDLLPCEYNVDGASETYMGDISHFDGHAFYQGLREGRTVRTSLLNKQLFISRFAPILEAGEDIIYVASSSGISGTCQAAGLAAQELMQEHPGRFVHVVDSLGCGFGNGLLAVKAAQLSARDVPVKKAAAAVDAEVPHICQYFTVDDLKYLKNTGRVSGASAAIATLLGIKPVLYGDSTGHIVACGKTRGRQKALDLLLKKFRERRQPLGDNTVCISHGDCEEDAKILAEGVLAIAPEAKLVICQHEPYSGAHVGPGMLGLFFRGSER